MKRLKLTIYFCLLIHAQLSIAQSCNPNIIADAPNSRYTINANGTVLDKKNALIWMRCALGQTWYNSTCAGSLQLYSWKSALLAAKSTVFAGKKDWRLPNIKELQSLVERRCSEPAINLTVFPNSYCGYWSSSPVAYDSNYVWVVDLGYGDDNWYYKSGSACVRLVRSGR